MNYEEYMNNFNAMRAKDGIVAWIKEWFDSNGKGCNAVIGISGGKDSTVVAALCVEALGKDRVIGVLMPNGKQSDIEDAISVVEHLCISFMDVNICDGYNGILNKIHDNIYIKQSNGSRTGKFLEISEQTKINLAPRIRMATLYAISQSLNGRVVGTDNASEAYIGYSTRWGDNVADLMPILDFTSEEVVKIGEALGLPHELTHKTPSDGLCGKTDEDNFGFSYYDLNKYIRTGVCENVTIKDRIDNMHKSNLFKLKPIEFFKNNVT